MTHQQLVTVDNFIGRDTRTQRWSIPAMRIPRVFHFVWHDVHMDVQTRVDSWSRLHPDWEVRLCHNDLDGAASSNDDDQLRSSYTCLERIWQDGGVLVDLALQPRRSIEPLLLGVGAFVAFETDLHISDKIVGAMSHHPCITKLLSVRRSMAAKRHWQSRWHFLTLFSDVQSSTAHMLTTQMLEWKSQALAASSDIRVFAATVFFSLASNEHAEIPMFIEPATTTSWISSVQRWFCNSVGWIFGTIRQRLSVVDYDAGRLLILGTLTEMASSTTSATASVTTTLTMVTRTESITVAPISSTGSQSATLSFSTRSRSSSQTNTGTGSFTSSLTRSKTASSISTIAATRSTTQSASVLASPTQTSQIPSLTGTASQSIRSSRTLSFSQTLYVSSGTNSVTQSALQTPTATASALSPSETSSIYATASMYHVQSSESSLPQTMSPSHSPLFTSNLSGGGPSQASFGAIIGVVVAVLTVISSVVGVLSYTTSVRSTFCALCRLRHHDELESAKQRWPLAAALYGAFLLPEPGFRGDITEEGRTLIEVECVILSKLGITGSLEGRGDDEAIAKVAKQARGLFVSSGGKYRFPPRRCCWLLGPHDKDVLALLGGCQWCY